MKNPPPEAPLSTTPSEEKLKITPAKSSSQETEEVPIVSSDIEDSIQLERREVYTELPIQKLLQYLLDNGKQEITPVYNPASGYKYENVDQVFEEKVSPQKALEFLNRLTKLDILQKSFFDSAATCPNCQSAIITMHYRCPKCRSHHIIKTSLTEHITCGYIAEREQYVQGRCPKCGNFLAEKDFRDMGRWYICRECGEKFEEPQIDIMCRKCSKVFNIEDAKMLEIPKFSLNPQRKNEIRQNVASLASISHLLSDLGFAVEMPGHAIGEKSGMQHLFSIIGKKHKQSEEGEDIITIDHAVAESEVQASPLILYVYKISEVKVDLPIFVAIPKLNETAKKIAQGHHIFVIEGMPTDEKEISNIRKQIENRLYHLDEEEPRSETDKGSMWKRPMLRRDEKKPSLIDVVPSIHPDRPPEDAKKKSFMNSLKNSFAKEKDKAEKEKEE